MDTAGQSGASREYWQPDDWSSPSGAEGHGERIGGHGPAFHRLIRWTRTPGAPVGKMHRAPYKDPAIAALRRERPSLAGLTWERPRIMGILNVTPDSFSDGGEAATVDAAVTRGLEMIKAGADMIDVGGESTRPGAGTVPVDEELERTIPVIEGLRARTECPLSIDTRKAAVMKAAIKAGARVVNDVSALTYDPDALGCVADLECPVILVHAQGEPGTMQDNPSYDYVLLDVFDALAKRITACTDAGIPLDRIVVDPGIGFGKTADHNLTLLEGIGLFHSLGCPVLLGASRKSFIGALSCQEPAGERLGGSLAAALRAIQQGVQLLRVHDVAQTAQAVRVWTAMADRRSTVTNGQK